MPLAGIQGSLKEVHLNFYLKVSYFLKNPSSTVQTLDFFIYVTSTV